MFVDSGITLPGALALQKESCAQYLLNLPFVAVRFMTRVRPQPPSGEHIQSLTQKESLDLRWVYKMQEDNDEERHEDGLI